MHFLQPINWWFGFRNHPPYATWRPSADAPRRACGLGNRSLAQLDMWKIHENSPPKKISRIILKLMWVKPWWITHLEKPIWEWFVPPIYIILIYDRWYKPFPNGYINDFPMAIIYIIWVIYDDLGVVKITQKIPSAQIFNTRFPSEAPYISVTGQGDTPKPSTMAQPFTGSSICPVTSSWITWKRG